MAGRRLFVHALFALVTLIVPIAGAGAATFSSIIVYGDSLSDDGHLHPTDPGAPYVGGRRANGPVAVETLAAKFGVPLLDFAIAGATTGVGNYGDGGTQTTFGGSGLPGMLAELQLFTPSIPSQLFSNSLFVVWGGANDFLTDAATKGIAGTVATAVADEDYIISTLQGLGAQHILVPGLPDLSLTPDLSGYAPAAIYTQQFNAALVSSLPPGVTYFDTNALVQSLVTNKSFYGLTDISDPCYNVTTGTVCSNPSQYLFWDGFHPTTAVDNIIANAFASAVAPTPEPSSLLLLGSGLSGLTVLARRARRRQC